MLLRAHKISSSFEIFSSELERIRHLFVNNNYPMKVIEECINKLLNKINTNHNNNLENKQAIKLHYENQMNPNYKKDENIIKDFVKIKINLHYLLLQH